MDVRFSKEIFVPFNIQFSNILPPLPRHILQAAPRQKASGHPHHPPSRKGPPGWGNHRLIISRVGYIIFTEYMCNNANWVSDFHWNACTLHSTKKKGTQTRYSEDKQSYLLGLWFNWTLFHNRFIHREGHLTICLRLFLTSFPHSRLLLLALVVHSASSPHQQVGPLTVLPWPLGWGLSLESLSFWCDKSG